jgi:hypothetical protein
MQDETTLTDHASGQEQRITDTLRSIIERRAVAEQVMKDLVELSRNKGPVRQLALGGLLDLASQRIEHSAERQLDGQSKTGVPVKELGQPPR